MTLKFNLNILRIWSILMIRRTSLMLASSIKIRLSIRAKIFLITPSLKRVSLISPFSSISTKKIKLSKRRFALLRTFVQILRQKTKTDSHRTVNRPRTSTSLTKKLRKLNTISSTRAWSSTGNKLSRTKLLTMSSSKQTR